MGNVGYKRPPTHSRFAKGKSGNPAGRPKGKSKANSLANIINAPVSVNIDGVKRKVPLKEATMMGLAQGALRGNTAAARLVFQMDEKLAQKQAELVRNPLGDCPPITSITFKGPDFEDGSNALFKLGGMHAKGKNWYLETWVVEAAFARNMHRDRLRNEEDYQDIAKSMMNPEDLPRLREKYG